MAIQLLDLPRLCIEEIFNGLTYSEISQLGAVCRYFREMSKTIFRLYFRRQEQVIEREMERIEMEASKSEKLTVDEHLYLALLHSVLRILLSEAKMLKAHCWRYMRDPSYDFCFPAGRILDEFEKILRSVREKTLSKDMELEISTTLFRLGEKFYDYFDNKIETHFRESPCMKVKVVSDSNRQTMLLDIRNLVSGAMKENLLNEHVKRNKVTETQDMTEKTLFGVKLIDILDCCSTSDFHSLLYYDSDKEGFQINTEYKIMDVNVLQPLPSIGLSYISVQRQLNKICSYIRNNVRWTNLFHPVQDLWMLEDAIELNCNVQTASALLRQWKLQRTSSRITVDNTENDIPQYNYRRIVSRLENCFELVLTANLECPKTEDMPLKLKTYLESYKIRKEDEMSQKINNQDRTWLKKLICQNWNENIMMYKFHLELKLQYPSFLTDKIQEAVLKVDQFGEETIVTSNSDEVRKFASCLVGDDSEDEK